MRNGFGKNGFQQRAAGRVEEQPALLKVGEVHRRIADAELIELLAKGGVAFQSQADVIDRLGGAADAVALRADEVDERTALGIEPGCRGSSFVKSEEYIRNIANYPENVNALNLVARKGAFT